MREKRDRPVARGAGHQWIHNNVIALLALFVALSGTAWASQAVKEGGGKATPAKKKKSKRGPRGPAGANGLNGAAGANGTAVAFAAVQDNGTLVPGAGNDSSRIEGGVFNITQANISHAGGTGVYCFTLPFAPKSIQVTASNTGDFGGSSFATATGNVRTVGLLSGCPANATARVRTVLYGSGAAYAQPAVTDLAFFVWFE